MKMEIDYTVADCMTTKPITCGKNITLQECAQLMKKHSIGSVLVMEDNELLGIVTEGDFVQKAMAQGFSHNEKITTILSTELISILPGKNIFEASKIMNKNNIHHLPVMEKGKLLGFITLRTLLKIEPTLVELLAERTQLRGIRPESPLISSFEEELGEGQCESCNNYTTRLVTESSGKKVCPNCRVM